jgi:hypothetical protein
MIHGSQSPRLLLALAVLFMLPLIPRTSAAQQTEVSQYDVYNGFTYFETPGLNLAERGYNLQVGRNMSKWLAIGFDYSIVSGHNSLTPNLLTTTLQQQLGELIEELIEEGVIPPDYQLVVPTDAFSQTMALGPQIEYRHFKPVTLFVRPSIGVIRQRVTPHPTDPVATEIVQQLLPQGYKVDWQSFWGFGGGFDWNATHHFGLRMQADLVYWTLFSELLKNGSWTVRFSVGPTIKFGKNILAKE